MKLARPVHLVEALDAHLVDAALSATRHGVRNRLGAIRNANFFIKKKVDATALKDDARVARFLGLIDDELSKATDLLDRKVVPDSEGEVPSVDVLALARRHVEGLSLPPGKTLTVSGAPVEARVSPLELEVALFCVIENALEAAGGSVRVVTGTDESGVARIEVLDDGPGFAAGSEQTATDPFFTTKPGRQGLGLTVALRIAQRWQGGLSAGGSADGGRVLLRFSPRRD